eukprot:3304586-Pleurochrysis_carterae.AAC.3
MGPSGPTPVSNRDGVATSQLRISDGRNILNSVQPENSNWHMPRCGLATTPPALRTEARRAALAPLRVIRPTCTTRGGGDPSVYESRSSTQKVAGY